MTTNRHDKPTKSRELQIFQYLHPRMKLATEEKQHLDYLYKGYLGELEFYNRLQQTELKNHLILYDLLLPSNHTEFQIDSLLIWQTRIFLFEVKNFEGEFYLEQDNWYVALTGKEIKNPLLQLRRSEFLLRQLLQKWGHDIPIEPYIIFIHPEFTLYQAPQNLPIILPTQLNRFLKKLHASTPVITRKQKRVVDQFIVHHKEQSAYEQLPQYEYDKLKKGIICPSCTGFLKPFTYKKMICETCGRQENIESSVMRSVKEFALLFPHRKITTSRIHEWCETIYSKKTIQKILATHLTPAGEKRYTFYLPKKEIITINNPD
ncbi:NERD domain-containing protein [Lederbergia sp. NSJ-179]|uniref:nuclease-related domain-containing protein n=1 Tax=Lederbergia sp. NSJ-179 TaxID=2931402 RepID=UPI001FD43B0C|nr:nuclease-related domain-containing protein [Lederbergia sp. NSJ-179]MCJ7842767.1 NERD domain-containing protein [Lederbergia sp. NSJ-179]